jgi:hypothetical protein
MIIYFVILAAIAARFVPHFPNVAPVTALAIFAAVYLPKKQAIVIPLAVRFISDIFLGFFSWPLMVAVYASHLVGVLFGFWIKKFPSYRWTKIVGSSLGASVIFFLATNFAFLYSTSAYPHNWAGVILSYTNALPFFRGTLLGDLGFTVALFGAYELAVYFIKYKRAQDLRFASEVK